MGVGDSLEAAFTLAAPIPAGSWHLVGDGIVLSSCDITYDLIWRRAGDAGSDTRLAEVVHHFDPLTGTSQFDATPFESDAPGLAADAKAGDQLILRVTAAGASGTTGEVFIPNGDGANAHGRIPSIALPR